MSTEENFTTGAEVEEEESFVVIDEITENDKGQGTEIGSELLIDSVETEKEIDSFLKNESKPQNVSVAKKGNTAVKHAPKQENQTGKVESKYDNRITGRFTLSLGGLRTGDKRVLTQMLLKRFGKNKYIMKPTRLGDKYTYLYFRSRECMKTAEKMLNNKMISGHRITAKAIEKKKVEKKTETNEKKQVPPKKASKEDNFGTEDYNEQVKYKEKYSRHQVLSLGDTLETYLPPLNSLISDRKKRHNGLICKVDNLKQCAPKNGAYCKCSFLIDLDADTGKPILGRFYNDGKVRKNWKGKQFYHPSILQAAQVFEKFVISSKWEVGRCNKGFWRKIHIRCNKSGELLLWLLVQAPEDKSSEELKKLKTLLTEFFQKGEGKKCKISSVYTRVTFTSSSKSNPRGGSMINLTLGKEHFEDNILGFKIKINPKISTLWNMEQSSMMCDAVKDLMALDDHTSVIIIGLNDSGLLALTLANQAGEVICVDKRMPVAEAKRNVVANKLESKCKFYAGFASEELRKISPKYKKAYAVVLVPTVTEIMAFKERKNLSAVKSIVTFLECSKLNSRPMKLLADPEQGTTFFPSRIIPFDTHPNEKTYMMAIRLERVHIPEAKKITLKNLTKSSASRSSRISLIRRYRDRRARMQHRTGILAPQKRERNRMLPDAREVILARRYRKEKELKSAPRFNSYEQPNLVIEVKKPSYGGTVHGEAYAERYVKERKIEAEEYRQRNMEERGLKFRGKPNIQDVLTDSLKQSLPSINEDTAEKLKQVIAEAITDAGFLTGSSSRDRKKRTPTPPRPVEHRPEQYMKYNHSSLEQRYERHTPVLHRIDDGRRMEEKQIEINRNSFRNPPRNDKRVNEPKYERISPAPLRISPNYMPVRKNSLEGSKRYETDKYGVDRRSNEARIAEDRSYGSRRDIHRGDYTKEVLPPSNKRSHDNEERLRRPVEHERDLLSARRVETDEYKRGIRPTFDRIGTRDQRNIDRRELDLLEYEKRNSTLTRSLEAREMPLHKRGPPQNDIYDEREALLARKRALDMQSHVGDQSEKRRRSQDYDPYAHRDLSAIKRRSLGDPPYRSSERAAEMPHYLLKDDVSHARKMTDVDRYERVLATERINERDRDLRDRDLRDRDLRDRDLLIRRELSNTLPQVPNRARDNRDYRHPAVAIEKPSMLTQPSFGTLPSGSAVSLDRRTAFQSLDRRMVPDSMLSTSNYPLSSLQRNMNLSQPANMDFRRPYSSFAPPR